MVGIEVFTEHFKDFHESDIVIGGVACEDHFDEEGLDFRATKDIDVVLVVEAVNNDFIAKFWEFIELGKYEMKQVGEIERKYYRFIKPQSEKKDADERVDARDVKKHRNDVFRLAATLKIEETIELPGGIKKDLIRFVNLMYDTSPDIKSIMKIRHAGSSASFFTIFQTSILNLRCIYIDSIPMFSFNP